jgi:CheY-like chemotaxis protein
MPTAHVIFDILLVDDSLDDVHFVKLAFQRAGLPDRVYVVDDGEAAVSYLRGCGEYADRRRYPLPHFTLLDLQMPRVSGFEVLEALRQRDQRLPFNIYALSGNALPANVQRAYELGVKSYLVKPGTLTEWENLAKILHDWHCQAWFPERKQAAVKQPRLVEGRRQRPEGRSLDL